MDTGTMTSLSLDPKPLSEDDGQLEAIWNSQHSLQDVIAPSEFKSYDELKQKLDRVLGMTPSTATALQLHLTWMMLHIESRTNNCRTYNC